MIAPGALSSSARGAIFAVGVLLLWTIAAAAVATYGQGRGFRRWPLFIAALFLGFPLVLLGVALAAGPERDRP